MIAAEIWTWVANVTLLCVAVALVAVALMIVVLGVDLTRDIRKGR